jgi:hypothetical protein
MIALVAKPWLEPKCSFEVAFYCCKPGISITRPAGRMWPDKSVYEARVTLKIGEKMENWVFILSLAKKRSVKAMYLTK